MVGRGACGAPWLPARIARYLATGRDPGAPPLAEQARIARSHVESMLAYYGEALGLRIARKHVAWYLETSGHRAPEIKAWRRQLCTEDEPRALLAGLEAFYLEPLEVAA
jgi:tRNA-dihydrouridine synthase